MKQKAKWKVLDRNRSVVDWELVFMLLVMFVGWSSLVVFLLMLYFI